MMPSFHLTAPNYSETLQCPQHSLLSVGELLSTNNTTFAIDRTNLCWFVTAASLSLSLTACTIPYELQNVLTMQQWINVFDWSSISEN